MYCEYWKLDCKPFKATFNENLISFKGYFAESYHKLDLYLNSLPVALCLKGSKGTGKSVFLRMVEKYCSEDLHIVTLPGKYLNERLSLLRIFEESQPLSNTRSHRTLAQKITSYFSVPENLKKGMMFLIDDSQYIYDSEVLKDLAEGATLCNEKHYPVCFIFAVDADNQGKICSYLDCIKTIEFKKPSHEGLKELILFRIKKCGGKSQLFTDDALQALVELSNRNIRELLVVADLSLQMGYVNKLSVITRELLENKVKPFMDQFREEDKEPASRKEKHEPAVKTKPWQREENIVKETVSSSPERIVPEKLINRTELESYKVENIKDPKRKEIEKLEKMIISGKMDLSKALGVQKLKERVPPAPEKDKKKAPSEKTKPNPLQNLDPQSFYQVSTQLITGILDKLRREVKISLESATHLTDALVTLLQKDQGIIGKAIENSAGYGLPIHMLNVCILSTACALKMNLPDSEVKETSLSALLHDIGHLKSGENLLTSSSRFNRQDFKTIKEHPLAGKNMIMALTDGSKKLAEIIAQEHERDDGLGYPNYLVGSEIHLPAKIIAVCDVYEALTHSRTYRAALTPEDALMRIRSGMIQQTDPGIINTLSKLTRPFFQEN